MTFTPEEQAAQLRKPSGSGANDIFDYMNRGNVVLYPQMILAAEIINGQSVLELGQGNGVLVPNILQAGSNVTYTGIDFSESSVLAATQNNPSWVEQGLATFVHGEIAQMPFEKDSFDTILGLNVIYFWEHPEKELAEIYRVLKPGGKLVFGYRAKHKLGKMPFTQFGFYLYEVEELQELMQQQGWIPGKTQAFEEATRVVAEDRFAMECLVSVFFKP